MTLRLLALLALLAVPAGACGDGDEEVSGPGGTPATDDARPGRTELHVVLDGGEFDGLGYTVTCGPDGPAAHPAVPGVDATAACGALAEPAVARLLVDGPPGDRLCTEVYGGPQRAAITGTVAGTTVATVVTRTNGCEIDTWDRLLAGLLPPTAGVQAEEGDG